VLTDAAIRYSALIAQVALPTAPAASDNIHTNSEHLLTAILIITTTTNDINSVSK